MLIFVIKETNSKEFRLELLVVPAEILIFAPS